MVPIVPGALVHVKGWIQSDVGLQVVRALPAAKKFAGGSPEVVRRGREPSEARWGWRRKWVGWTQIPGEAAGIITC